MTIKGALEEAKKILDSIEANILIKYIIKKDNSYIIANLNSDISKREERELFECLSKLKNGYPLQYITHHQEFMGLDFEVNEDVLIPQPDTEVLVEIIIKIILDNKIEKSQNSNQPFKILDLCTGSGVIAISLKKYLPNTKISASDISNKALEVAKRNATKNEVNINFIQSNMFENVKEKFDIIVSNPPYIKTEKILGLSKQVQTEPKIAIDGGNDGLHFYKIIAKESKKYLYNNGIVVLEIGYDQKEEVTNLLKNSTCIKDYSGNNRVVIWSCKE